MHIVYSVYSCFEGAESPLFYEFHQVVKVTENDEIGTNSVHGVNEFVADSGFVASHWQCYVFVVLCDVLVGDLEDKIEAGFVDWEERGVDLVFLKGLVFLKPESGEPAISVVGCQKGSQAKRKNASENIFEIGLWHVVEHLFFFRSLMTLLFIIKNSRLVVERIPHGCIFHGGHVFLHVSVHVLADLIIRSPSNGGPANRS